MKICPACQQSVGLNLRDCPHCGHRFIPAIAWICILVVLFVALVAALALYIAKTR
jgi:hypothetical protein